MKIQSKIKVFTLRVARNILPTRTRLLSKNIQVGNGCYLCGGNIEEVWYLMNSCPYFLFAMGAFEMQVQVDPTINDLQACLKNLQNSFSAMNIRDRELVAAIWEGAWS